MKCHNCNHIIEDERMNFCPKCRTKLIKDHPTPEQGVDATNHSALSITRNKAIWKIEKGEIARKIDETEFDTLDHITGLIVRDGTSAIVYVDGKRVCSLNGGVYDFISQEEVDKTLDQYVLDSTSLYGIGKKLWRGLVWMIRGKKVGEKINQHINNDLKTMDEVIRSLKNNSVIATYLKIDNTFPLLYGKKEIDNFIPLVIKTKYLDAELAVTMMVQISDFDTFIKYYLVDKSSVTTSDIQEELKDYIVNILQEELKDQEVDSYGLSPDVKDKIKLRIKALDSILHGIQIVNITDITSSSKDFERFRLIAKQLYCSEKELDFLKRTNEFKNRLVSVENEQKIWQAKNDLEIKKALDLINNDGKLYEEEQRQFYVLLSRQRRIREAQNEMEISKALNDIKQTDLLNQDEFEAFQQSIDFQKFDRKNVDEIMRLQSLATAQKKELAIKASVLKCQIEQEADLDVARFDAYKQSTSQAMEKMDMMEVIYGKKHLSRKQRILEEQEVTSLANRFKGSQELENAVLRNKLLLQELEGKKMVDNYDLDREKGAYDFEKTKEADKFELLQKKQAMALKAMSMLKEMENAEKDKQHNREIEKDNVKHAHIMEEKGLEVQQNIHRDNLKHEEVIKKLENRKDYSAEQLFADSISELSDKAAEEYAASFRKEKEIEAERRIADEVRERERKMEDFFKHMMDKNKESEENLIRMAKLRFEDSGEYTRQRMNDYRELSDEYKEQMKHEQQRHDLHQDKALQYTTQVTEAEYKSYKPQKKVEPVLEAPPVYYVDFMGEVPFQLEQLRTFAKTGVIKKNNVIRTSESRIYASDLPELRGFFQDSGSEKRPQDSGYVVCSNCKEKIKVEDTVNGFCPYCNNEYNG